MHNKAHNDTKFAQKLKPGLVAFYDIQPGNIMGLFSKKWIIKKVDEQGKSKWGT